MNAFLEVLCGMLKQAFQVLLIYYILDMRISPLHKSVAFGKRTLSPLAFPYKIRKPVEKGIPHRESVSYISDESQAPSIHSSEGQNESLAGVPRVGLLNLPTEILQAIFCELPTLDDARALSKTSRVMHEAFQGYERGISLNILSRQLGLKLSATFGALAIFVSPRKGLVDEPLRKNLTINPLYWEPMLKKTAEVAKKLLTLKMADQMLAVYRQFPKKIDYRPEECDPHNGCSACKTSVLDEPRCDTWSNSTNGNCIEHLLQANAVRYRLNCRMVLGYVAPDDEVPEDSHGIESNMNTGRIIRKIMQMVSPGSYDGSDSDDGFSSDGRFISDEDVIMEDAFDPGDPSLGDDFDPGDISLGDDFDPGDISLGDDFDPGDISLEDEFDPEDISLEDDFDPGDLSLEIDSGYESMSEQGFGIHPQDLSLENDSGYESMSEQGDGTDPEDQVCPDDNIYPECNICSKEAVCVNYGIYEEDGTCQKCRLLHLDELYQQNALQSELYENDFELWMQSDEALSLLDKIR